MWPGYRVYQHEIDEKTKTLRLWVRRKGGNRKMECSGCGRRVAEMYDVGERAVRDLQWRISHDRVRGSTSAEVPGMRSEARESAAVASKAPFSRGLRMRLARPVRARQRVK